MLHLSAGALLGAGVWPGSLGAEERAEEEFHFLVVNDLHHIDKRCSRFVEGVLEKMKAHKEKIDFCLIAGDLGEDGKNEELAPVRDLFKTLGMPIYVVIGNHDYGPKDDRKPFEELFPKSLNYYFEHRGWQFLGLDTSDGVRYTKTAIQPATLRWLDDTLPKLDQKRPTVIFTHFPLGPKVTHRPTNADELLDRFKPFNLQAALSGHFHGFTERQVGDITLTTNRCCSFSKNNHDGTKEKGYFLCQAKDGKVRRTFIQVN